MPNRRRSATLRDELRLRCAASHSETAAKPPAVFSRRRMFKGSIVLQIAALTHESDALAMADALQQKKFPSFVVTPTTDNFYRVQVGPYPNETSGRCREERARTRRFQSYHQALNPTSKPSEMNRNESPWYTRVLLALASGLTLALSFPNYNLSLLAWISVGLLVLASCRRAPGRSLRSTDCFSGLVFYPLCLHVDRCGDEAVRRRRPVDVRGHSGADRHRRRDHLRDFFTGAWLSLRGRARCLPARLRRFLWVARRIRCARNLPIFAFPWNLIGLRRERKSRACAIDDHHRNLRAEFHRRRVSARSSPTRFFRAGSARGRQCSLPRPLLILVARGRRLSCALRAAAHSRRASRADQFSAVGGISAGLDRIHAGEMNELETISVDAAKREPGLIVWPEVPAPFSLQDAPFAARAAQIARDSGSDFLVGVVDWKRDATGKWLATNSAVLLDPSGQPHFHLRQNSSRAVRRIRSAAAMAHVCGQAHRGYFRFHAGFGVQRRRAARGHVLGAKFGVFICYEAIFPNDVRHFTADGAELLINISNDGWFGRSAAPAQHLMMARVRAVENRRWLLRDTNNGYTVSVDPYGRIVARTCAPTFAASSMRPTISAATSRSTRASAIGSPGSAFSRRSYFWLGHS